MERKRQAHQIAEAKEMIAVWMGQVVKVRMTSDQDRRIIGRRWGDG
jgi:hypothetical protein